MSSCCKSMLRLALLLSWSFAFAGNEPPEQTDVSIAVAVTPSAFLPGDRGTVTLTLHNAGPALAGTTSPGSFGNYVIGPSFRITEDSPWGPFDIVWESVQGCFATYDILGPGEDLSFGLTFQFYFDVIAPGASLTCTFNIVFLTAPFETFVTKWSYIPRILQTDTVPGNNDTYYTFVAGAPQVPPRPVPSLSWRGQIWLVLGIGLIALRYRWESSGRLVFYRHAGRLKQSA